MAKLAARGRTELLRISKENEISDPSRGINWSRTTIAIMSDGTALQKYDVRFLATTYSPERKHSYGWKVLGKVKNPNDLTSLRARYEQAGYTIETR